MIYPPPWNPDRVLGVIAPASAPRSADQFELGLHALAEDGYQVHWTSGQLTKHSYLSGSDLQRAVQFNDMLPQARHLIALRGGYGCLRILDQIDYNAAKSSVGVLIGFSDITALQLALFNCAGWRSISGPVVVEWHRITSGMKSEIREMLEGHLPTPIERLKSEREGQCTGTLLGGNLSMITRMVGSHYLPDLNGKILFIEDVNEPPYRIDGLLTQLKHAGILEGLGGLIVGGFTKNRSSTDREAEMIAIQTVVDCVAEYPWPVATGLVYGHFLPRLILPIGVRATLTVDSLHGRLDILEPIVR